MKIVLIALLVFITCNSFAQNTKTDSLKQLLRSEIRDTTRIMLLVQLSKIYRFAKPDTSFLLANQGIILARKIEFKKGEANCLRYLGSSFWVIGNYPKAMELYLQALKIFEVLNDQAGMANVYSDIGNIYSDQGDERQAIAFTVKQQTIAESLHRPDLLAIAFSNLGDSFEKLNQLDSARFYAQKSFELAMRYNNSYIRFVSLVNLGNVYSKMHQDDIAMGYYRQSLLDPESSNNIEGICEASLRMAKLFSKAGQPDSALHYSLLSLAKAYSGRFTDQILNASIFISEYFRDLKKLDSAYYYQEITIAAKDSLFSLEKVKAVQNLSFEEKVRQQKIEEAKIKAEEERKSNIQLLGIVTFISFFFGLLFVFSKRHVNPKIIKFFGLLGLLLLFEFISLFLHPYIAAFTHHTPVYMLLILVAIASMLVPIHHKLQRWVKEKLDQRTTNALILKGVQIPEEDKIKTFTDLQDNEIE